MNTFRWNSACKCRRSVCFSTPNLTFIGKNESVQSQNLPKIVIFGHRKPTQWTHSHEIWRVSLLLPFPASFLHFLPFLPYLPTPLPPSLYLRHYLFPPHLPYPVCTKCRSPKNGKNWGFSPLEGDRIYRSRQILTRKRLLWVSCSTPDLALIGNECKKTAVYTHC